MLEPDPDKRPARVTTLRPKQEPNATRTRRERAERQRQAERESQPDYDGSEWRRPEPWDLHSMHQLGREQRRQMKLESRRMRRQIKEQIRNETRRIKRHVRDLQRSGHEHWHYPQRGLGPLAPLLVSLVVFALSIARIATWLLFRAFLPTLLAVLSLFFGRGLRRAAWRCRDIGMQGDIGLRHAMDAVRGSILGRQAIDAQGEESASVAEVSPEEPDNGQKSSAGARVRVAGGVRLPDAPATSEEESETEDPTEGPSAQRRQ